VAGLVPRVAVTDEGRRRAECGVAATTSSLASIMFILRTGSGLRRQFEAKGRPKRVNYRAKTSEKSVFLRLTLYPSHWGASSSCYHPLGRSRNFSKKVTRKLFNENSREN
jgi:hypothetical protein